MVTVAARTGASAVVAALEERGVEYLFGVPGHGAYPIYGALTKGSSVTPIVGRNEQGISFIADAWSWVTNRVAVATTLRGGGSRNSSPAVCRAPEDAEGLLSILDYVRSTG